MSHCRAMRFPFRWHAVLTRGWLEFAIGFSHGHQSSTLNAQHPTRNRYGSKRDSVASVRSAAGCKSTPAIAPTIIIFMRPLMLPVMINLPGNGLELLYS